MTENGNENPENWVEMTVLGGIITYEGSKARPSQEFITKVLTNLGLLDDTHPTVQDLFNEWYPSLESNYNCKPQPSVPIKKYEQVTNIQWLCRIPTNITGVEVGLSLNLNSEIKVIFFPEALKKIQPSEEPYRPRY